MDTHWPTKQLTVEDFIEELIVRISYLKLLKGNLKSGELLILMDFAENYSFIVQDAIQGFHWENSRLSYIHLLYTVGSWTVKKYRVVACA